MLKYDETVDRLKELLGEISLATVSNPIKKSEDKPDKLTIKPVSIKGKACYQLSCVINNKAMHTNIEAEDIYSTILDKMREGYKQCNVVGDKSLTVLMNKHKEFSVTGVKANPDYKKGEHTHNKQKNYILRDGEYVEWLYYLDVMDKSGRVHNRMQKKFRQINRFVEMLSDIEANIPDNSIIVDMGCGKSYLSFATYYYFNVIKRKNVTVKGYDLKADVVEYCNGLAERFGFKGLEFYCKDIAEVENTDNRIAMIITLHACDTATDYAIYHGIRWGCRVLMNVPCCQHELFRQIENNDMSVMLRHGILKERFAALMTDSIRAEILRLCGYRAEVMEFIDMEHTPKNIMIRSVYNGKRVSEHKELDKLIESYNIQPTLYRLVKENGLIK